VRRGTASFLFEDFILKDELASAGLRKARVHSGRSAAPVLFRGGGSRRAQEVRLTRAVERVS